VFIWGHLWFHASLLRMMANDTLNLAHEENKMNKPPVVMTIAGFDPSAGAGVLADVKTISAFGGYGVAAITSLTVQNTQGVFGAQHQRREFVREQIDRLVADFHIAAIKTGMLPTPGIIEEVAEFLSTTTIATIVVDPVIRSTSGFDLIDDVAVAALVQYLFPLAAVVTPNAAEAERLTGIRIVDTESMKQAAAAILAFGPRAVLIKGGDVKSDFASDVLLDASGAMAFNTPRVASTSTHGTGCTLSAALACLLARGMTLGESVPLAKRYINAAIAAAPGLGRGHGPLNHFPPGGDLERAR
jgi:hydroxymethylpyrimidine/phosphomethylpyrimidine kinase